MARYTPGDRQGIWRNENREKRGNYLEFTGKTKKGSSFLKIPGNSRSFPDSHSLGSTPAQWICRKNSRIPASLHTPHTPPPPRPVPPNPRQRPNGSQRRGGAGIIPADPLRCNRSGEINPARRRHGTAGIFPANALRRNRSQGLKPFPSPHQAHASPHQPPSSA